MENREVLENEIKQLEEKATYFRRHGNEQEYEAKMAEINKKRSELDQQAKNAVIADVQSSESSYGISIGGETVDFREVTASEEAYQALTIVVRLKLAEIEQKNKSELSALKASYEAEIQQENAKYDGLYEEFNQAKLERNDLQTKWEAAANERNDLATENESLKAEIESYKAQVEELRAQVSKPNTQTNLDNDALGEAMRKLRESKRAIYNVVNDGGNINYTARFVDTDEGFTDKLIYIGKYRVLSEEEAARFREDQEAAQAAIASIAEHSEDDTALVETVTVPEVTFREEDTEDTGCTLDRDEIVPTSAQNTPSGETFEERTERRLALLEAHAFGEVKAA